jgi:hypothetical protein
LAPDLYRHRCSSHPSNPPLLPNLLMQTLVISIKYCRKQHVNPFFTRIKIKHNCTGSFL